MFLDQLQADEMTLRITDETQLIMHMNEMLTLASAAKLLKKNQEKYKDAEPVRTREEALAVYEEYAKRLFSR